MTYISVRVMIPIETLEIQMTSVVRSGVRKAAAHADILDIRDPLHTPIAMLESLLYAPLYGQILKTYTEGYRAGGELIERGKPHPVLLTAADLPAPEDPRIARATKTAVYGIQHTLGGRKNEIQAILRRGYETGATMPQLTARVVHQFDGDQAAATRFVRTATNDIYNRAHLDRYEDSNVVDGVEYSAHIDQRTSNICRMLDGTIYALGDSGIQVPPMHFYCRSRLKPYWGGIPGKRNFKAEFGSEYVADATKVSDTFRSKYWSPMPRTKASATYQRSYFPKNDIKTLTEGLNLVIKNMRAEGGIPIVFPRQQLKDMIRYRKVNMVKSTISDKHGQALLLDKFEEKHLVDGTKSLIAQADSRLLRETARQAKVVAVAWGEVLKVRKGVAALAKDIEYYRKRVVSNPVNRLAYQKIIATDLKRIKVLKMAEQRRVVEWTKSKDMPPSAATMRLESEKERYEDLLKGFKFSKR